MQSKAEQREHIHSIEFRRASNAENLAKWQYSGASEYSDCLDTRSKASSLPNTID